MPVHYTLCARSMVKIIRSIVSCMLLTSLCNCPGAIAKEVPGGPDAGTSILIAEAQHLRAICGDSLWPGWSTIRIPILLISEDCEYAIDFPTPLPHFTLLGADSVLHVKIQTGRRTHDKDLCAALDVEGIQAVVAGSPEETGFEGARWVLRIVHEMFHVFQNSRGANKIMGTGLGKNCPDGSWMLTYPFPYQDTVVMASMHLQGYLLWQTLQEEDNNNSFYALGTTVDALSASRRLLSTRSNGESEYRYSQLEEWIEGVALYTEYRMARLAADTSAYKPTKSFEALRNEMTYANSWGSHYSTVPYLVKHAGKAAKSRGAFYHPGLGKALVLDRFLPRWKESYFESRVWLNDLIEAAYNTNH
jgi:hypothetical protein